MDSPITLDLSSDMYVGIECCKNVQIYITYQVQCTATTAEVYELTAFVSPRSCIDYLSDIQFEEVHWDCSTFR